MEKVLFHHGGTKLPSQRNKMFHDGTNKQSYLRRLAPRSE